MSPRDVTAELRAARVEAPPELRARVRLIAAAAPAAPRTPILRRRRSWLVAVVPVAAALAAAGVVLTRSTPPNRIVHGEAALRARAPRAFSTTPNGAAVGGGRVQSVPASPSRVQRYGATLSLRLPNAARVSDAVKRALRIAASLSGYASSVHVSSAGARGSASLVLRIPRANVQQALARLSALGTITGEHVDVQDLQAGLDATDRTIARLQRQLAQLRTQPQTDAVKRQVAALTARVVALQRARATTVRSAHFATVRLSLSTPAPKHARTHRHGPLHGLGVAFRWIGIGLVYALALGVPALIVVVLVWLALRALRRRREDALLARS